MHAGIDAVGVRLGQRFLDEPHVQRVERLALGRRRADVAVFDAVLPQRFPHGEHLQQHPARVVALVGVEAIDDLRVLRLLEQRRESPGGPR